MTENLPTSALAQHPATKEHLSGWGRALRADCWVLRPSTEDGVCEAFALARRAGMTVGLRGAGQSYGDAALNGDQVCLDVSRMSRVLAWDPATGRIRVEPGVTIRQLWRYALEDGWWPPVVPGTSLATLGGCTAMNVHGKNNWKAGPLGDHVDEIVLLTPAGERRTASRTRDPDLFHAAVGGFGMLGCMVEIELRLHRVACGDLIVEPLLARSLDEMLDAFARRMDAADYLVGWVDGLARGAQLGRGIVHQGRYAEPGDPAAARRSLRREHQELPDTLVGLFPKSQAWRAMRLLLNGPAMRAVNAVKYHDGRRHAGRSYLQPLVQFSFLLDFLPDWRLAYGPEGMIQYQAFVPEQHAARVYRRQIELSHEAGLAPLLGVLKRHRTDPFLMSHAVDGYSLALEFKVTRRNRRALWDLARRFDALVVEAGGRFYFAKDSTLSRETVAASGLAERVRRLVELKRVHDPETLLQTDLYRRLIA